MSAEAKAPESGSNFSLAFLFLSAPQREALRAVYAFCRHVDDIVDSGELPPQEAARALDEWNEEIERLYAGKARHHLAAELIRHVARYSLPKQAFLDVIAGVRMDLERSRYETFPELERYLYGVAGAVGLLCVEIFGYRRTPPERVREYATAMGNAFQLTNILRDVGSDLERGRIYLPMAELREAGCSEESILHRSHTPEFSRLMQKQYERAKGFYSRARALLDPADRVSMLPAEVMAEVYEEVLEQVRSGGYRVFFHRTRLPAWQKVLLAGRAWGRAHGVSPA
ncbi:MAG: presqualene diphosphate synthase HpnD [Elusimicrobiota bacterium]|jgi:phytoene synthase